jgi:hypothetical protein
MMDIDQIVNAVEAGLLSEERGEKMISLMVNAPTYVKSAGGMSDSIAGLYSQRMMGRVMSLHSTEMSYDMTSDAWVTEEEEMFVKCDHCTYENAWERGSCDMCGAPLVHMPDDKVTYDDIAKTVAEMEKAWPVAVVYDEPVMKPSLWQDVVNLIFGKKE